MNAIEYLHLDQVDPQAMLAVLNENTLRAHLIDHPYFNETSLREWVTEKTQTDAMEGCRVRAVVIDGSFAGWCAIQPDDDGFELAIVISQAFWGSGISIFKTLLQWAHELGHSEVLFHLLDSRRSYRALEKMAFKVRGSERLGRAFTSYYFSLD